MGTGRNALQDGVNTISNPLYVSQTETINANVTEQNTSETGGQNRIWMQDDEVRSLLENILKELKIMNIHLMSMTDENIKYREVE